MNTGQNPYTLNSLEEKNIEPVYPNIQPINQNNNVAYGQPVYGQPVYGQPVYSAQPAYPGQAPQFQNQPYAPGNQVVVINKIGGIRNYITFPFCPVCQKQTNTTIRHSYGGLVWLMALVFCLFTGYLCFIPFFVDQWKDK